MKVLLLIIFIICILGILLFIFNFNKEYFTPDTSTSISIGKNANNGSQAKLSIALGTNSVNNKANSINLCASENCKSDSNGFIVTPVNQNLNFVDPLLLYNTTTNEITYNITNFITNIEKEGNNYKITYKDGTVSTLTTSNKTVSSITIDSGNINNLKINYDDGTTITIDISSIKDSLKGYTGPTGPIGPTGPTGYTGPRGIQGPGSIYFRTDIMDNIYLGKGAGSVKDPIEYCPPESTTPCISNPNNMIGIGIDAGKNYQKYNSIAIGTSAGLNNQKEGIAIGNSAGQNNQIGIAIGNSAGYNNQKGIAIGNLAGYNNQDYYTIAIGNYSAEQESQGLGAISIGYSSGQTKQGEKSIAIGYTAGQNNQAKNSIVINATGDTLDNTTENSLKIAPVRNDTTTNSLTKLYYNKDTAEITYNDNLCIGSTCINENDLKNIKKLNNFKLKDNNTGRVLCNRWNSDVDFQLGVCGQWSYANSSLSIT
jgi:hypothetical protein